jgi:putative transposase
MAKVEVRYNYRLRVHAREAQLLQGVFDSCRFVWNQALGRWGDLWRHEGLSYSYGTAAAELTDWRSRFEWLADQPQCPQQQTLRHLYRSISAFLDRANPAGRPKYKKRRAGYASAEWTKNGFTVGGTGLGIAGDRLAVATSAGRVSVPVVWSRPLPTEPTSVTIYSDRAGRWFASFVVRLEVPEAPLDPTGRTTRDSCVHAVSICALTHKHAKAGGFVGWWAVRGRPLAAALDHGQDRSLPFQPSQIAGYRDHWAARPHTIPPAR